MAEDDESTRPRIIHTSQYVKDRISQIAELLEVVDNSSLNPGEVTSGPRTILQRLPRHMRRRAMSHNIKRLPRAVRGFATKAIIKTKHRKKAPSRKWRRRPSRLLKRQVREMRKNSWLETHIWHAKRFLMSEIWGYKLAIRSYQKGFRPTYRNAINSTVVFDQSYLECMQIVSNKSQEEIIKIMSGMCINRVSVGFGFKPALNGGLEMGVLLYEPGQYPRGFLGPARFSWSKDGESHRLQLWVHPSTHALVLDIVLKLFEVHEDELEEIKEKADVTANRTFQSSEFAIFDLRYQLARIQLVGPKALSLLNKVLRLTSDAELSEMQLLGFLDVSHGYWFKYTDDIRPGNLKNGSIISLFVEDPRLFRVAKRKNTDGPRLSGSPLCSDCPEPCTLFWNTDFRNKQFEKRLSSAELQKQQANKLEPLKSTQFKIPVLLVIRNHTPNQTSASMNRVDLIVPGGTGLDFWLAIQFADGRAAGLQDKVHLDFESGLVNFPSDCADSKASQEFAKMESKTKTMEHLKKPENRRIRYEASLKVKYPFSFNWDELVDDWSQVNVSNGSEFYALRDKRTLLMLSNWLSGKNVKYKPEEIMSGHSRALIPVKLEQLSRGRPKRLALVCLPNEEDILAIKRDRNVIIQEQVDSVPTGLEMCDQTENNDKEILQDYIPLFGSEQKKQEKLVSLNEMFPDQETLKRRRNVQKRKKRTAAKKQKILIDQRPDNGSTEINAIEESKTEKTESNQTVEPLASSTNYRNSCTRTVIGRIVRGDYSFVSAQGISFGYCPATALCSIQDRLVMLRNPTSKFYHPARISVHIHQPDL